MADIVIINPRFAVSYWGMEYALPFLGKRANLPVACLPLLAALTDMPTVPTPRFDLLKMRHYAFGSLQFSRGCPFQCEFCDIIVTFGRRPRIKTSAQIIVELEALLESGIRIAFVVDDNLIG